MRPQTARELVEFAGRHLGLSREEVIARANELLPARQGGRRGPDELVILWRDLVSRWEAQQPARDQPPPEPPSAPEPAGQQDSSTEPEPAPVGVPSSGLEPAAVAAPVAEPELGGPAEPVAEPELGGPVEPVAEPEFRGPAAPVAEPDYGDYESDEDIDVDDLVDAPSHAVDIEARIMEMFPGSELEILPESDEEGAS